MGNCRSCGFTVEHSWVLLLRLGRNTRSHTHSSPDLAALTPWKVSTKNHCTHVHTYMHFLLSFLEGFCFFLAYEVQRTFKNTELRGQGGGQGAGLCLEECTGFRLRPTSEKILPQVWWELQGWGKGEHMSTDSWSSLPGGEEQLRKASWTGGSPSWGWKTSRNVLGQCFRQKAHSDPEVQKWGHACYIQGTMYHLVLLEMEKGDWRVLRALRCMDWHSWPEAHRLASANWYV